MSIENKQGKHIWTRELSIVKRLHSKLFFSCYFGYFEHAYSCTRINHTIKLKRALMFICLRVMKLIPYFLLEILQFKKYLFSVLLAYPTISIKNDSIKLKKSRMRIGMWKMNFIYHFLFEIYEFKNIIFSPLSIPNHAHMILSSWRNLWSLSTCIEWTSSLTSFLR